MLRLPLRTAYVALDAVQRAFQDEDLLASYREQIF